MAVSISIPTIQDYRIHLLIVLSFVSAHLELDKAQNEKPYDLKGVADLDSIAKLKKRLSNINPDKVLKISKKELLLFHSCTVLMNKFLVSKHDEVISIEILKDLPEDHILKHFNAFRDEMIRINTYLIADTEKKYKNENEMSLLRAKLAEIDFDS